MQASGPGPRRRDGGAHRPRRRAAARARRRARRAHGMFVVANRNAPGQVVVSGERAAIEAGAELAKDARREARDRAAGLVAAHSPLMAEAADGDARAPSPTIEFHDPTPTLLANADGRPITTADGCRAELVEHLTAGVDWVGAVERMTAAGVTTFVEVGPGKVLTGLIKRIAPGRRGHPRRRPRARSIACSPSPPRGLTQRLEGRRHVRKPDYDRRVVVTGLGVISPVGNDVDDRLVQPRQRRVRPGPDHPLRHDAVRGQARAARSTTSSAADWMDAKAARRSESSLHFGVAAAQAGARRLRLRADRREPDRGRRRLRLGRRRPAADDRQLHDAPRARPAHASPRRSSPTPSPTAARG